MEIKAVQEEVQKHIEVFCCYARKDQILLQELKNHLMPLKRKGLITLWADTDINAGEAWEKEIHLHLNTSHIILLLVSPDFMASDYCYSTEMTQAMKRHESGQAHVIPIILRPVEWQQAPFAKLQVLPQDARPIISSKWAYQDEGFADAARGIREAVVAYLAKEERLREAKEAEQARLAKEVEQTRLAEEAERVHRIEEERLHQAEEARQRAIEEERVRKKREAEQAHLEEVARIRLAKEAEQARLAEDERRQAEEEQRRLAEEGQPANQNRTLEKHDPAHVRQIVREATQVVRVPLSPVAQPVVVDLEFSFLPDWLTQLGFQALVLNDGTRLITPPMCDVLPGPFEMGTLRVSDPQAYSDELPAHRVSLNGFRIARFPVTVAEYDCAVRMKRVREPDHWVEQLAVLDQPVVYISWDDAVQYANWLAEKTSEAWRLPTEAEWEKAAKWDDLTQTGHRYPWGEEWNSDKANTKEHHRRWVSKIGSFPQGASPCGALDMCGNVSEWTHSIYKSYPYNALDGCENERSADRRVIRGGSWFDPQRDARTTFRVGRSPIERLNTRGFRLALSGLGEVEE